jgi:tetratricopeptide (TPR) repeat protein
VKEPLDEFHHMGYEAYHKKDYRTAIKYYKNAVAIEPGFVKGHLWLAKCYFRTGQLEAAYRSIMEAIRLDERDIDCRVFADNLALKYYGVASAKLKSGRYNEAVAIYQKVLALKPTSAGSWIELGKCYAELGMKRDARSAWREALGIDPENKEVYALLKMRYDSRNVASVSKEPAPVDKKQARAKPAKPKIEKVAARPVRKLPAFVADDSIGIVKKASTGKGTRVESALSSVVSMTRSLGTPVIEKGWQTRKQGEDYMVRFLCEQGEGMLEIFEWHVNIDSKRVQASNANARLLMDRW